MDSAKDEIIIQKALNNQLSMEELHEFRQKYENNKEFAAKVQDHANLITALRASKKVLNEKKSGPVIFKKISFAASVIIILSAAVLLILNSRNDKEIVTEKSMKAQNAEKYADILENQEYLPNPALENNIRLNYRTSNTLPVLSTSFDSIFIHTNEKLLLKFENEKNTTFNIQLYNNQLQKEYQSPEIVGNKYSFHPEVQEGLYYMKIQTTKSSIWAGRIFIVPADSSAN